MQMIFARRNGAVSGEQRDGEELSDMVESRDIVTVARRPSHVARRTQAQSPWGSPHDVGRSTPTTFAAERLMIHAQAS